MKISFEPVGALFYVDEKQILTIRNSEYDFGDDVMIHSEGDFLTVTILSDPYDFYEKISIDIDGKECDW